MPIGSDSGGGGGSGRAVRAGGAFVEFFADTKKLKSGFEEIKSGIGKFGSDIGSKIGSKFNPMALLESTLGRIKEQMAKTALEVVTGSDKIREGLENFEKHVNRLDDALKRNLATIREWKGNMGTPAEELGVSNQEIDSLNRAATQRGNDWGTAEEQVRKNRRGPWTFYNETLAGSLGIETDATAAVKNADLLKKSYKSIVEQLKDANLDRGKLLAPETNPKVMGPYNQALAAAKNEIELINRWRKWGREGEPDAITRTMFGFEKAGVPVWDRYLLRQQLETLEAMRRGTGSPGLIDRLLGKGLGMLGKTDSFRLDDMMEEAAQAQRRQSAHFKRFEEALRGTGLDRVARGGFNASAAGQQFSVAEQQLKKQTGILEQIQKNTGDVGIKVMQALKVF